MEISTPARPRNIQISRRRLGGLIAAAAAVAAAATGLIVAFTVPGTTKTVPSGLSAEVLANAANVPLIRASAVRVVAPSGPGTAQSVRAIVSLTPVQLLEAFGTDTAAAAALASLTPQERLHVESLMALTPAQLRAAFGTGK